MLNDKNKVLEIINTVCEIVVAIATVIMIFKN